MAVETAQHRADAAQVKADAKADAAAEKAMSPEEKADKELQEANKKRQEERAKFVDESVVKFQAEVEKTDGSLGDTQTLVKDIADRVAKTQVIAAGARYGPSPMEIEELNKQVFPLIAPPLPDGTPVANIAQVERKEDDTAKPKSGHAVAGK